MEHTITTNMAPTSGKPAGAFYLPTGEDIEKAFCEWLEASPATISTYRKSIRVFLEWTRANGLANPTREDLKEYRRRLFDKQLKPTTIAAYINAVKQFYAFLEYRGITPDITRHLKGAKVSRKIHRKQPLTLDMAKSVLASIDQTTPAGKRDYAIALLLLSSGMRTIEITRANVGDIEYKCGEPCLQVWGKGRDEKERYSKLPLPLLKAIRSYLDTRANPSEDAPLFASESDRNNGGRLTTRSVSRILKTAYRSIGVDSPLFTAHSTRHFVATELIKAGKPVEEVATQLGHVSTATTSIYIHALERAKLDNEATLLGELLG